MFALAFNRYMALVYYILSEDGTMPVKSDYPTWAQFFYRHSRQLALDRIDNINISTIFLGVDTLSEQGYPLLFETMVFGENILRQKKRYATYEEAMEGHRLTYHRYFHRAIAGRGLIKPDEE